MEKIVNEDSLIVLKFEKDNNSLITDFLNIDKIYQEEFDEFKKQISLSPSIKLGLKSYKSYDFLLLKYDFCSNILGVTTQNTISYNSFGGLKKILTLKKEELIYLFEKKLIEFRFEEAYKKAEIAMSKNELLSYSHKRIGWSLKPFKIDKNFSIHFNTNFGYGYVSYFYLVIIYKGITIIPYSEWIFYHKALITEIKQYTQSYSLKDKSWVQSMEYCKKLYNLSNTNEEEFLNKYVVAEAEKMIEGLKEIMKTGTFKLFDINKDIITIKKDGYKIIEYRGEKISGALKFISHLRNFIKINKVATLITEIEKINAELLIILKREYDLVTERLVLIEPQYLDSKKEVEVLKIQYNFINERHNEINDTLHKKYNEKYSLADRTQEIEEILDSEIPNWRLQNKNYFDKHNNLYNPLRIEVEKLKPFKENISLYIYDVDKYFKNS